jgi:DNA-binding CsgD family transcriptional regulator
MLTEKKVMNSKKPKIVSFSHNLVEKLKMTGIDKSDFADWPVEMVLCESFKDLSVVLSEDPILIIAANDLIRKYGSLDEFLLMTDTLIKFNDRTNKPTIAVAVCTTTAAEEIKQLQKNSINVFPSIVSYGLKEMMMSVNSFLTTGRSWPKHIIDQLVGNKEQPKFKDIHLTARQKQVYDLIARRGLTNKQIAQVLKISESTVKIHVSAVMRALCVRNRTQLALTK